MNYNNLKVGNDICHKIYVLILISFVNAFLELKGKSKGVIHKPRGHLRGKGVLVKCSFSVLVI